MKGIILAGGNGTRLHPLTKVTNKHLLPIYNKPMIYYPLEVLQQGGIEDVLIVTGDEHVDHFSKFLGSVDDFDMNFSYTTQKEAGGIAQALGLAEDFVGNENCIVVLGDNIFFDDLSPVIKSFHTSVGAKIFLKETNDAYRFGIADLKDKKIIGIEEKPDKPKSNFAVTGVYMYDARVFDIIRTLKPSARGELEITDVNNHYINDGLMEYEMLSGWWTDAGTFDSLLAANHLIAQKERLKLSKGYE